MRLTFTLLSAFLLTSILLCGCGTKGKSLSSQNGFTQKDANAAFDSFHAHYYNPASGVYRTSLENDKRAAIWTQAIFWDMAMNAYERTDDKRYRKIINDIFEGAGREYDNYNWDNAKEWFIYDDIMWWVISLARAYDITGDKKYLALSESGFDRVWNGSKAVGDDGSYDKELGGMRWGWERHQRHGKMACINFPTVVGAMTLYNATDKKEYFDKAVEIYDWARNVLFDTERGRIADHKPGKILNSLDRRFTPGNSKYKPVCKHLNSRRGEIPENTELRIPHICQKFIFCNTVDPVQILKILCQYISNTSKHFFPSKKTEKYFQKQIHKPCVRNIIYESSPYCKPNRLLFRKQAAPVHKNRSCSISHTAAPICYFSQIMIVFPPGFLISESNALFISAIVRTGMTSHISLSKYS